jgi:hypothetical protein
MNPTRLETALYVCGAAGLVVAILMALGVVRL